MADKKDLSFRFEHASDIGPIGQLLINANGADEIKICMPISEKETFDAMVEEYNARLIARTNPQRLIEKLHMIAEERYEKSADGSYRVKDEYKVGQDKEGYDDIKTAVEQSKSEVKGNMVVESMAMNPEAAEQALTAIADDLKSLGYSDIKFIAYGTFKMVFSAAHEQSSDRHIIKINGFSFDDDLMFGHPIAQNLKTIGRSGDHLPEGWQYSIFPETVCLHRCMDVLTPSTKIQVTFEQEGSGEDVKNLAKQYDLPGDLDLIANAFENGLPEGFYAIDDLRPALAVIPHGHVVAYDMGAILDKNAGSTDALRQRRAEQFASLGRPFQTATVDGIPLNILYFQPDRAAAFRADLKTAHGAGLNGADVA